MHGIHIGMGVSGSCIDVCMTQDLLHNTNISASFQSKGRKGMTAAMRTQSPHLRIFKLQRFEELVKISVEVPGMPQSTVACTKDELSLMW